MRQISGDVIKVITANEHFPLGGCLVPYWQERLTCFLHIYLDYLQGILKVVKANDRSKFDNTRMTERKMYLLLGNGYFDKSLKDFPKRWQQAHI